MQFGFADRRMTAASRSEAMAAPVKRRLVVRAEHLVHGLLHDPIDHVGNAKASLPTSGLRDPHAADIPGPVAAVKQLTVQSQHDIGELLAHLVDALPVWSGRASVGRYLLERSLQILFARYFLH